MSIFRRRDRPEPYDPYAAQKKATHDLYVLLRGLDGFVQVSANEPMPPFRCDYCGCLVSAQRAKEHRARCTWDDARIAEDETDAYGEGHNDGYEAGADA